MDDKLVFTSQQSDFDFIDFDSFHQHTVNDLIALRLSLVQQDLVGTQPLTIQCSSGGAYTYSFDGNMLSVTAGSHGDTIVKMDADGFSQFFHELLTVSGMQGSKRIEVIKGDIGGLRRWELALRALFSGRPIYTERVVETLLDRQGQPLDFCQQFTFADLADKAEEMRHFFLTLGYIHIKQVFSETEIQQMRGEIENAVQHSDPDDGKSWWSVVESGAEVPTRINYLNRFSKFFDEFGHDSRVQALGKLHDPSLLVCLDRVDGPMVFIKSANVVSGLANLLWHKDCDLGGHPIMCPIIQLGIQLDNANAENGQVCMLAGSNKYSNHLLEIGKEGSLPVIPLVTKAGDVTLHFGHTLHCTPAPISPSAGRRVLYYKFEKPAMFEHIPAGAHYNDVLFSNSGSGRTATRASTWKSDKQLDGD